MQVPFNGKRYSESTASQNLSLSIHQLCAVLWAATQAIWFIASHYCCELRFDAESGGPSRSGLHLSPDKAIVCGLFFPPDQQRTTGSLLWCFILLHVGSDKKQRSERTSWGRAQQRPRKVRNYLVQHLIQHFNAKSKHIIGMPHLFPRNRTVKWFSRSVEVHRSSNGLRFFGSLVWNLHRLPLLLLAPQARCSIREFRNFPLPEANFGSWLNSMLNSLNSMDRRASIVG